MGAFAGSVRESARQMLASAHTIRINGAGVPSVVGSYAQRKPDMIPEGFALVCRNMRWDVKKTWHTLSDLRRPWFEAENGAYMTGTLTTGSGGSTSPMAVASTSRRTTASCRPQRAGRRFRMARRRCRRSASRGSEPVRRCSYDAYAESARCVQGWTVGSAGGVPRSINARAEHAPWRRASFESSIV